MKDGRTHLAHKAEHAADLETGAVVGVTVQTADTGDTTSMIETLIMAAEQLEAVQPDGAGLKEVVGDKGYHSNRTLTDLKALGLRSYISEPDRGRRCWKGRSKARDAVYGNRRRDTRCAGSSATALSGRTAGAPIRARVRDRRDAAGPSTRPSEHPQAAARAVCRLQPWAAAAAADRCGHAAEPSGPGCGGILRSIQVVGWPVGLSEATSRRSPS